MPSERGPGRPKKTDKDRRDKFLRVRVTDAEDAAFQEAAQRDGEGAASTWLRKLGLARARKLGVTGS